MFRALLIVMLSIISSFAAAACSGRTYNAGENETEAWIEISDNGCEFSELMINSEYKFKDECQNTKNGFTCRKDGHTPLAGTTYVITRDSKSVCGGKYGERFTCKKGCSKFVPKHLNIEPYEC